MDVACWLRGFKLRAAQFTDDGTSEVLWASCYSPTDARAHCWEHQVCAHIVNFNTRSVDGSVI